MSINLGTFCILLILWSCILLEWSPQLHFLFFLSPNFLAHFLILLMVRSFWIFKWQPKLVQKISMHRTKSFRGPTTKYIRLAFDSNHHKTSFLCLAWQNTFKQSENPAQNLHWAIHVRTQPAVSAHMYIGDSESCTTIT